MKWFIISQMDFGKTKLVILAIYFFLFIPVTRSKSYKESSHMNIIFSKQRGSYSEKVIISIHKVIRFTFAK